MIKIMVEVKTRSERFSVAVSADSICQALALVDKFYPASRARIVFPIDPEMFFIGDPLSSLLKEMSTPGSLAG